MLWGFAWMLYPICSVIVFDSLALDIFKILDKYIFRANLNDWWLMYFLWNYSQLNGAGRYWWLVNIGSGNGLLSLSQAAGFPEPMLTLYGVTRPQRVKHFKQIPDIVRWWSKFLSYSYKMFSEAACSLHLSLYTYIASSDLWFSSHSSVTKAFTDAVIVPK